jgi:tRNA (guanine37-N1)-methyltransferase
VVFLAPQGERFDDAMALRLAEQERLLFVCGHYEGIDERAYSLADSIISIGDYVLTSGELASMVIIDAVVRRLDGVLGDEGSSVDESFYEGLLEYPQYTRPASYRGMDVPDVLLSGHHAKIAEWRRQQSLIRTKERRPDLLKGAALTAKEKDFLESL